MSVFRFNDELTITLPNDPCTLSDLVVYIQQLPDESKSKIVEAVEAGESTMVGGVETFVEVINNNNANGWHITYNDAISLIFAYAALDFTYGNSNPERGVKFAKLILMGMRDLPQLVWSQVLMNFKEAKALTMNGPIDVKKLMSGLGFDLEAHIAQNGDTRKEMSEYFKVNRDKSDSHESNMEKIKQVSLPLFNRIRPSIN